MLFLLIFISVISPPQVKPFALPSFSDLRALFDFAYDVYSKLNDFHDLYNKFQTSASLNDIMIEVNDISRSVTQLGNKLERKLDTIVQTLLKRLPLANEISADLRELHRGITTVDTLFDDFSAYTTVTKALDNSSVTLAFNNATILSFAQSITKHGSTTDLNHIMSQMHSLIAPGRGSALKESLILLLSKQTQMSFYDACDMDIPPHQRFFEIYSVMIMTEMRAFLMTSFAYTYRTTFEEGTFMAEVELRKKKFIRRTEVYMRIFYEALRWSPRGVRRCDPPVHKRGETFHEFERFINTYIVTEEALNSEQSCTGTCGSQPNLTMLYDDNCEGFECDFTAQSCQGTIIDCRSGENKMQVCLAPPVPRTIWNPRRYEWFRDGSGVLYGNNQAGCQPGRLKHPQWYWKHTVYSCDVCICTCVDDKPESIAHHFVSLREVVADINKNMVVAGMKFITTNTIIQIEIQQGKLERDGGIEYGSTTWKKPEDLSMNRRKSQRSFVFEKDGWRAMKPEDIAILTYKDRTINLDQLEAPKDHLITGVRFSRVRGSGDNTNPIQLEIRVTPFDYFNGILINIDESFWITPNDMKTVAKAYESERTRVDQPDYLMNPVNIQLTIPNFAPNKWIKIEKTGNREDAGQTIIPLLDGVPVEMKPALPLTGVNLFHKTAEKYGGFLSFQILVIDRTEYMKFANQTEV